MSVFERYLTLWVFLCILAGIAVGRLFPGASQAVGRRGIQNREMNSPSSGTNETAAGASRRGKAVRTFG